jgi:hypothetical protein
LKDSKYIEIGNNIKNQLNDYGVKAQINPRSVSIEKLREAAKIPPEGFEIRVDYNEEPVGEQLVIILKKIYPTYSFKLVKKKYHK